MPTPIESAAASLYDRGHTTAEELAAALAAALPGVSRLAAASVAKATVQARRGGNPLVPDPIEQGLSNARQNLSNAGDAAVNATRVGAWFGQSGSWVRIAYVAGGSALILIAVSRVLAGAAISGTARVGRVASVAAPGGKVAAGATTASKIMKAGS